MNEQNNEVKVSPETPEFVSWFAGAAKIRADYVAVNFPNNVLGEFRYEAGLRYIRVICESSVHAFIDMRNGDVLKPAGWKSPAKHARGNIFDASNGLKSMGPYGPAYLR